MNPLCNVIFGFASRSLSLLILLVAPAALLGAESPIGIELEGFVGSGPDGRLCVVKESGKSGLRFLRVGEEFRGYALVASDFDRGTATFRRGEKSVVLTLRNYSAKGSLPDEFSKRGIVMDDLLFQANSRVSVALSPATQKTPKEMRYVNVEFFTDTESVRIDLMNVELGRPLTLQDFPEKVRPLLDENAIAIISTKWRNVSDRWSKTK